MLRGGGALAARALGRLFPPGLPTPAAVRPTRGGGFKAVSLRFWRNPGNKARDLARKALAAGSGRWGSQAVPVRTFDHAGRGRTTNAPRSSNPLDCMAPSSSPLCKS